MLRSLQLYHPRFFAIGDIHGCHNKLVALLHRLPLDKKKDILIFMGDYINRGPDSRKVLDVLLTVKKEMPQTVFLKGNHEQALLEYAEAPDPDMLRMLRIMGVEATAASYGAAIHGLHQLACLPPSHREFLSSLQLSYIFGDYRFVHADIDEEMLKAAETGDGGSAVPRQPEAQLLASRRLAREHVPFEECIVVFGHLPFASPLVMPDRIGIDTGAVYGNVLTAVELPALRFYHA